MGLLRFLILALFSGSIHAGFVHPGLMHTQADFTRMAQKVSAKISPWIDTYNVLLSNGHSSLSYTAIPQAWAERGSGCDDNSGYVMNDAAAAYQLALVWKITGNTSYADKAVSILNGWASTLKGIGCNASTSWDFILMAGTQGYQFANAAEIMRNYSGFSASNLAAFQTFMRNVWYPICARTNGLSVYNVAPSGLNVYANWDLGCMAQVMAIGVLTDNSTMFNEAVSYFKTGAGNGAAQKVAYYIHPGYYGQCQEAGRDQGHNTLDISHLTVIAQQAWNQGVDLYGYSNNRILAISEHTSKGNLNDTSTNNFYTVPYVQYIYDESPIEYWQYTFANGSQGIGRPTWGCIYHHYVNVKGLAAPFTGKMLALQTPENGGLGCCSGGYDQLGFESLTCALDPISSGAAPSGLTAVFLNGKVLLSWWGSAYATSYVVQRGTASGGPYTTLASGITDPRSYEDSGMSAGTYYYIVRANSTSGPASNQVSITTGNPLIAYYKFDETSGTSASDSSGNGYTATLSGSTSFVSGRINNGVKLDGSSGYISLPTTLLNQLGDFTIATWVYVSSSSGWQRLFDFGFGTGRYMFFTTHSGNGSAQFAITYNGGGDSTQNLFIPNTTQSSLPLNTWTHIAITHLGTQTWLLLNGQVVNVNNYQYLHPYQISGSTDLPAQYWIGRSQYSGDAYLNGIVDDFRIYAGCLSASSVQSLASMSG